MSIPLDNLYHWVEGLLPGPAIVYVFRPHGSKNISNLNWLNDYDLGTCWHYPGVIMHDQEPLDWNLYNSSSQYLDSDSWKNPWKAWKSSPVYNSRLQYCANFNLNSVVLSRGSHYDNAIIVHSEKNSNDLTHYQQNEFVDVYYWAHAMIARDWYRFAEHDVRLNVKQTTKNKFLIYCRDWSNRREYRLKFLEMLVKNGLDIDSQVSVMHTNSEQVHFLQHQFINPAFKLSQPELISKIPDNEYSSTVSADYNHNDFISTDISVILETEFDGSRIHLTEKMLRPIACGHPFILAAGPGSLEYLRDYGFQTFAPWIDESYDSESDSLKRLEKIIQAMKQIHSMQGQELENFVQGIKNVAEFNKRHFFSQEFLDLVKYELKNNLQTAYQQVKKSRGKHYLAFLKTVKKHKVLHQIHQRQEKTQLIRQLRQSCQGDPSIPREDPFA
jgi:hypothetical protein